jgi:prepilin peptidase CpaA
VNGDTTSGTWFDAGLLVSLAILVVILTISVYTEMRDRRIPNGVTLPGLAAGLAIGFLPGGISLSSSVLGFLVGFGVLFVFYVFGGMGGGDVKLMGAVGALLGFPIIVSVVFYTSIIGGLMAVAILLTRRDLLARCAAPFRRWFSRRSDATEEAAALEPVSIPYGIAIAVGCLLALGLG